MIKGITHIIFDLGGVILDIDYDRSVSAFKSLGIDHFEREFSQMQQSSFFEDFERGLVSSEDFITHIQGIIGNEIDQQKIIEAWNAMLIQIPLRRLQILQQLQLHFDTFLLSNTNAIHEQAFNKMLKEVCGFNSLSVFFDRVYYSHHIGMRKPDEEIFLKILNDHQLNPSKTLFIDDSPQHIATAERLGIQTILLSEGMTIEDDVFLSKNPN